jgi:hypothetical protein
MQCYQNVTDEKHTTVIDDGTWDKDKWRISSDSGVKYAGLVDGMM